MRIQADVAGLSLSRLASMARAGDDVLEALRVLGKAGTNPVAQALAHQGKFFEMNLEVNLEVYARSRTRSQPLAPPVNATSHKPPLS